MSIFDRLLGREQKALTISERGELPGLASLQYTKHSFTPVTNFTQAYRLWKENPVAQGCTQAYALTMPEAYLAVRQDEQFIYDHPVSQLFSGSSWRLSMATAMTYLCIGGNVYYHKLRNNAGAVIELRPYSDANFAPVLDEYGNIRAYHYYNGSNTWEVSKDDVVHIRGFWVDPAFSYAGGSPIVLASTTIESYNEASGTIFSIHKNDAMPKTLVIYDEELSPDQISLAERSFKRKYGGERRGSVGHMWGVKSVERLALDYQELGMESTFSQYEARICGVYRVHPIIAYTYAGIMSSTYSNAEQASKDFTDMVRVPLWQMIADQINAQFAIPEFGVEVAFDLSTVEALKPSAESQQTIAVSAFQAGVLTLNEAREAFGLEAVTMVQDSPDTDTDDDTDDDADITTAGRDQTIQRKEGGPSLPAGFRSDGLDDETFFKAVDDISEKWAKRIATAFAKEAAKLEAELIADVKSFGMIETKQDPFDVEEWTQRFLSATEDARIGLVEEMVLSASSDVNAEEGEYAEARREGIDESSDKIKDSIGKIRDEVREVLRTSTGLSAEELADKLRSKFATIKSSRADAIGRTTATATTGKTQRAVWETVSANETNPARKIVRQWVSFPGARDAHSKANGQFEDLEDGVFTVGGERTEYPAGPGLSAENAVNCRCITRARRRADYDRLRG